jgi:hypothetical protein
MAEISIVVPVLNEEKSIKTYLKIKENILDKIGKSYEIIFAFDPSFEKKKKIILDEIKRNKNKSKI